MDARQKVVAVFDLPHGEGQVDLMVDMALESSWTGQGIDTSYFMFHKPHCGGPMRPIKVADKKMVLYCSGCVLRLQLLIMKLPTNLGELGEAINETCTHSDLPSRF